MRNKVHGVIANGTGQVATLETIRLPDPGPGDALVKVQAHGLCHTGYHYREVGISGDFPFLLGHEAMREGEVLRNVVVVS